MADASPDASDTSDLDVVTPRPLPAEEDGPLLEGMQVAPTASALSERSRDEGATATKDDEDESGETGEEEEDDGDEDDDEDEDEEEDDDEEPQLKYARLTRHLGSLYRNGDATSAFLVAGDKMVVGTHNGNIHVIQLPTFRSLRVYHAHSASVTSVSISPNPPPVTATLAPPKRAAAQPPAGVDPSASSAHSTSGSSPAPSASRTAAGASAKPKRGDPNPIPNIPSNNIYIATSSLDGNVCVQSLLDIKDVQLRSFARPVQAVALSPDYKNDRTYLSGGKTGNLVLGVGGPLGRSTSTTTGSAAAITSGWLGTVGLGGGAAKETVLHHGEGTIGTIKWSLSGKYVVWLNEVGFKIMRSGLHFDAEGGHHADEAWRRIGGFERPQNKEWDVMAGVWRGRAEWIDEKAVPPDGEEDAAGKEASMLPVKAGEKAKAPQVRGKNTFERLIVGWGSRIWIVHVHPGGIGVGRHAGERLPGRAEIVNILNMDCIISGISLYTQTLLLVLAYTTPDDDDDDESEKEEEEEKTPFPQHNKQGGKQPIQMTPKGHKSKPSSASAASRTSSEPAGGIRKRQNNLPPELRLIDLTSQSEVSKDGLSVSRYERLGAADYHLGLLPAQTASAAVASRGAFEALAGFGEGIWSGVVNPGRIFGSGSGAVAGSSVSVRSQESGDVGNGSRAGGNGSGRFQRGASLPTVDPALAKPGVKIFIHSPYDCILATKRDLADHLGWLMEREMYQAAWELVDEHPEIVTSQATQRSGQSEGLETPDRAPKSQRGADDFYDDSVSQSDSAAPNPYSNAEKEKRRIGELWIQDLVEAQQWRRAGQVAGKVLSSADRWEKWVWTFAGAGKFDEIADYMPTEVMKPPIKETVYEVVLGHYLQSDKVRFRALLERWGTELFDTSAVVTALENQLNFRDVREDTVEGGEKGRDWRIVLESLARLQEANGRNREALKHYIRLQDADSAMRLIKERHLADAVADDIPSFIALRVPAGQADRMERKEIEEATAEAISLLVDEAQHGLVKPEVVVGQLQGQHLDLYTFFYLRGLLHGEGVEAHHPDEMKARLLLESRSLVDDFADLAVRLFAKYERDLLMDFFEGSTSYSFDKAVAECEHYGYVPELVYLYSKTGQTKRALYLIIDRLGDVNRAIGFAREQDDAELWEDLLEYSMDKPRFIHGLLEGIGVGSAAGEGGATIDPVKLVRRIPEGLQVEGLREGLRHLLREHEVQMSISGGAAKVVRGEVAAKQALLRAGQRKGIRFEVVQRRMGHVDVTAGDVPTTLGVVNGRAALVGGMGSNAAAAAAPSNTMVVTSGGHGTTVMPAAPTRFASDPPPPPTSKANGSANGPNMNWKPGHCAACLKSFTEDEEETLVGFACGHVFHLSHLLKMLHPDDADMQDTSFLAIGEGVTTGRRMRVGLKVTHARLLKERVEGGCPVDGRRVDQ